MREGQPSATARLVSFARGLGSVSPAPDRYADLLLPPGLGALVRAGRVPALGGAVRAVGRVASLGMVDHMTRRTIAIDRVVVDAVAAGARQCVILGAGLDTRAHRVAALGALPTFELDHPSTQAEKRRRLEEAALGRALLRYVPIDFARETIEDVLPGAGFDPTLPTVWLLEGVTMYLTPEVVAATFGAVARLSAPGSVLGVTYISRRALPSSSGLRGVIRGFFGALGEPLRAMYTRDEFREALAAAGFALVADTASDDWGAAADLPRALFADVFQSERLAKAVRGGSTDSEGPATSAPEIP
jgi:methyltransferase (TIGR00027 family)